MTECEVTPTHSVLDIVVEGESTVFGNEALNQSKEIAHLVSELEVIGYSKKNITLESISIKTSTGKILKASSARFNLLLQEVSMEQIPKILGLLSSQKNIEIREMHYEFSSLESEKNTLLREGCHKAKEQTKDICSSLGISLLGVYSMSQKWSNPVADAISQNHPSRGLKMSMSRSAQPQNLEGLDFITNYKNKLLLTLEFDFRVGKFND